MISQSLNGVTIALAGVHTSFAGFKDKKIGDLKEYITDCGGSYSTKVNDQVTHLIATSEQYAKNGQKVKEASKFPGLHFVTYEWLAKSFRSKKKVDEDSYLLNKSSSISNSVLSDDNAKPATTNGDKKRRRADSIGDSKDDILNARTGSKKAKQQEDVSCDLSSVSIPSHSKDSQNATQKAMHIPIDEGCTLDNDPNVFVDSQGDIYDVTLNQTNAGNNNNKFYRIQLLTNNTGHFYTWTRWGRVGEYGSSKMLGSGDFDTAMTEFKKKFKDKSGNTWENRDQPAKTGKYTYVERNYEESSSEDEAEEPGSGSRRGSNAGIDSTASDSSPRVQSKLAPAVQRLMNLIFNQQYFEQTMSSLDYDATKMPLGKLSKKTLLQGYEVLKNLAGLIGATTIDATAIEANSNQYFSLIPHSFGRRRPPVLDRMDMIKKEIEVLEALTDLQLANEIMKASRVDKAKDAEEVHIADRQYEKLGLQEMTPLDIASTEFKELETYLVKSAGTTHNIKYKVQDIFRIERTGENDRFNKSEYASIKNSNRRLLWHGSRCTNFGGILSQGLRIAPPEAPVSGYMFGKGVYLADMSTKSANYCCSYTSGNIGLLLLCEAELGEPPLKLINGDYEADIKAKQSDCISTLGMGITIPQSWKDAGCVNPNLKGVVMPDLSQAPGPSPQGGAYLMYNEYIVYDVAQLRLRYLFRVEMR